MRIGFALVFNPDNVLEYEYPPLGIGYLAAYLRERLHFDDMVFEKNAEDLAQRAPDLICLSAVTQNYTLAVRQARKLKEATGARIILGGSHITSVPESLDPVFDLGVIGEGEETLCELAGLLLKAQWGPEHWEKVRGIVFRAPDGKGIVQTPPRDPVDPLDRVPLPDREFLGDQWGLPFHRFASLMSSRGCPYHCAFCSSRRHFGASYPVRFFSAEYVVNEIESLHRRWNPQVIGFHDDLFIADRARLREIGRLICQKGLHEGRIFRVSVRANLLDDEMCRELKSFNVAGVTFGAESGSEKVLRYLKGENVTVDQNQRVIDLCRKHELLVTATFVVGSPPETRDDLRQTLEFVRKNRDALEAAEFYPIIPFPQTPVWEQARAAGKIREPVDWDAFSLTVGGEEWWRGYNFLNEHMTFEEFLFFYAELREESLQIALRKKAGQVAVLEDALRAEWRRREELERRLGRRAVRWAERLGRLRDSLLGR